MGKEIKTKEISISNRKAWHEYEIIETFEAGMVLVGTEVKSLRAGKASLQESYCKIENGEATIYGMYITPYEHGNIFNGDPIRPRKLLLHKAQLNKINRQLQEKGLALIPLKLYFTRGYAKLNLGIAKGKKLYDKRDSIAKRDVEREKMRELSDK